MVKKINDTEFLVMGRSNPMYKIHKEFSTWTCECKSFEFRKEESFECKHIIEVKMFLRQGKNL